MDIDIHEELLRQADLNASGAAIARHLAALFPDRAPHENTVYAELKRHADDGSGAWTLADDQYSPAEAAVILEELTHVLHKSGGQRRHFTKREAWWVLRLKLLHSSRGFTPLEPGGAYHMARLHIDAEQRDEQLAPWLDAIEPGLAHLYVTTGHRDAAAPKEKSQ
jgi:hypothetical protein